MIYNSFINVLFVDDKLNEEVASLIIHDKGIETFPINYFGATDIRKEEINQEISCYRYNRSTHSFDIPDKIAFSDVAIIFIDYQLEGKIGIDIKNQIYASNQPSIPKLILLSGLDKDRIMNQEQSKKDYLSDNRFHGYIAKDSNQFLFQNLIYSSIYDLYKIEESIFVKNDDTIQYSDEPFKLQLEKILNSSSHFISRLWISKKNNQIAYFINEDNNHEANAIGNDAIFNNNDLKFLGSYLKNEDYYSKELLIDLHRDFGHEINFSALQSNINISSISHQYVSFVIKENTANPLPDHLNESLYLSAAYEQRKEEGRFKVNEFDQFFINKRKSIIQLSSYQINPKSHIFTLGILISAPKVCQNTLFYKSSFLDLIEIFDKQKYLKEEVAASLIKFDKINDQLEYYKIKITIPLYAEASKDKVSIIACDIISDIQNYLGTILRDGLDQSISIFDLIGPSIVGPSSSHTCGANRIGRLAKRIIEYYLEKKCDEIPDNCELLISARLHDSFRKTGEGHKTFNALPAGLISDLEKDHDGLNEKEKGPNIADYPYKENIDYGYTLQNGKKISLKWIKYNLLSNSHEKKFDIPLPNNFPKKDSKPDLHENAVAVFVSTKENANEIQFTSGSDWANIDLIIIGESIGGGKIQIKSVGGKWINKHDSLLGKYWDYFNIEDNEEAGFFFYDKNKAIKPLNGATYPYYEIQNIESYPPFLDIKPQNQNLSLSGLNDLEELFDNEDTNKKLLELIYIYEYWHLTGINYFEHKNIEAIKNDFIKVKNVIDEEANKMFTVLKQSQEEIIGLTPRPGPEYQNIGNNYDELCKDKEKGFKSVFSAANFGAITAMVKNAHSMKILAAPTGGACGVLPGVLSGLYYQFNIDGKIIEDKKYVEALLISGFLAAISSNWVPPAGAALGCQAETGTGAAMGAAFACYLLGGKPRQIIQAYILALKNTLGLVCDPIAGKVNTPCIKRNGFKAIEALNAAHMSLSGVTSYVRGDEVLMAMREIGLDMQSKYRETSEGGLARTPKGLKDKYLSKTYCSQR